MSVTTANGVSATLVQPAIYRGAVAPTSASVGDLWEDISTSPPVFKQCSVAPSTWVPIVDVAGTLPTGGTAGQILAKIDATDYNTEWIDNYATQLKFQAKNTTGSTLAKGTVVYVSGGAGANPYIAPALATSDSTSATTVGLLESTTVNNGFGLVVESGTISGIDTSSAVDGDPVWLSGTVAGGMVFGIANKPHAPTHLVYLGTVTRAHAINGEIQVKVANGWELDELHDVLITSKSNDQVLQYEASTGLWKNKTQTTSSVTEGTNLYFTDARAQAALAPRVSSTTSTASITPDVSAFDQYCVTAQAVSLTINAPIGSPVNGTKLIFRLLDNGSSQTISWNATFTGIGVTLPTATVTSKMTYVGCIYNAANTRWDVVAVTTQQ